MIGKLRVHVRERGRPILSLIGMGQAAKINNQQLLKYHA